MAERRAKLVKPIDLRVDLETNAAYVRYADASVAGTIDVWQDGWVAADMDGDAHVIGIEVLDLQPETLEHARQFAHAQGLAFPDHLDGIRASA